MKYPQLKGKCLKYLNDGSCLGCNRLERIDFVGDDNCSIIQIIENRGKNGKGTEEYYQLFWN